MTGSSGIDTDEPAVVAAGMRGAGDYRCLTCGYGVVSFGIVPECPMCHGSEWSLPAPVRSADASAARAADPTGDHGTFSGRGHGYRLG